MQSKMPPLPVRIVVALIVLSTLVYYGLQFLTPVSDTTLAASGTIEAAIVNVSPEMSGKVTDVNAVEGEAVTKDQPLLNLDASLLTAQQAVASAAVDSANAALASAQTKYDQTLESALAAQAAQRSKDWKTSAPSEFDQPNWYIEQEQQVASAQAELDAAQAAIDEANTNLERVITDLKNSKYLATEQELADARAAFVIAQQVKDQAADASDNKGLTDAAQDYYDDALTRLDDAEQAYNDLMNSDEADDVKYARGQVLVAQQRYDAAYARLLALQTGGQSPAVISAARALDQAKSALSQAEASLALLDAQVAKLTVHAPMDGVILTRNVEPGEFVQPGAVAMTMADLSNLTITVYIPEDRYGEISLGQTAEVKVDSFPEMTFTATVTHIADQAEFTPRNVQTVEGRSATLYAIKLSVQDFEGKLKIGMPADVTFK
ncbi:MAG TPA: efflux RND transporter periplasmic adaptor subunit [Anaerolineales bacterium]|nr:efflux RND transporter periplasmic adaptor subunit [Anaerolineales bacterium]HNN13659.1 efflux RND transporter periplasmic adaptor subunit [Anaerolineales bacterium]HNO32191.1 efflux RND transporter periplasmic adaptor subunit [Anaerolineales bacterium]